MSEPPNASQYELSTNWKKLQDKLKPESRQAISGSRPVKRKSPAGGIQRRRENVQGPRSTKNTGMNGSEKAVPAVSASLALWAEDNNISAKDLAAAYGNGKSMSVSGLNTEINKGLSECVQGKYIAIDCEMVGVGPNPERDSALARVSLINYHGEQLYDSFVLPKEEITDYRTAVSGITPTLLKNARTFESVQMDVAKILNQKILVGHAVRNDLEALLLGHPQRDIRDTSRHANFRKITQGRTPGLKRLAREVLGLDIQSGEHSSIEDARAAMLLFRKEKEEFEREHTIRWGVDRAVNHGSKGQQRGGKGQQNATKGKKKARR